MTTTASLAHFWRYDDYYYYYYYNSAKNDTSTNETYFVDHHLFGSMVIQWHTCSLLSMVMNDVKSNVSKIPTTAILLSATLLDHSWYPIWTWTLSQYDY
jgi:hypothetical protein